MALPSYIKEFSTWEKEFQYFDSLQVRFSETDAFGHVNNTVAFVYFEQARIHFFQSIGVMDDWVQGLYMIVTGDLQCDYRKQVVFGETLHVGVKIDYIGTTSIDVHYLIKDSRGEVCMTGRGRIVQVEKATGHSVPWEEKTLDFLKTT